MLVGAVGFSNLSRNYGLPAYFVGILVDDSNLSVLDGVSSKESFQPNREQLVEPFDLSPISKVINEYNSYVKKTINKEVAGLPDRPKQLSKEEFLSASQVVIDQLKAGDLMVLASGVSHIRVHDPFNSETERTEADLTGFMKLDDDNIVTERRGGFSGILQLARLVAWHRYLTSRRAVPIFVRGYLRKSLPRHDMKHLIQLGWPRVGLSEYTNSFVGFPEIVVRNGSAPNEIVLAPGSFVSLFPVAKCCVGPIDSPEASSVCSRAKTLQYGEVLPIESSEIRCPACRSSADRLKFGLKAAKKVSNDKNSPLGKYNEDFHYVYVSAFGKRLKVGRARLSRGISRIMEQGASDALVLYPFTSFEQADEFESQLVTYLKPLKSDLRSFDILDVAERAYVTDKLDLIRQQYNAGIRNRAELYNEVLRLIMASDSLAPRVKLLQSRILSFQDNWWLPDDPIFLENVDLPVYWNKIEGKLEGCIGSLVIVSGKVVDLEKLQGSIFRGNGFEPERN